MAKSVDNSWVEGADYVTQKSLIRAIRWANKANGVKAYIDAIGISSDFNPRFSATVTSGGDQVALLPTNDHNNSDYMWFLVTDNKGNFAHGEVTDLVTPAALALNTSALDAYGDWTIILRARKTGDTQDAVVVWPLPDPSENPVVTVPAGY